MATVVGHPLLVGEDVYILSQDDVFLRWRPGHDAEYITIAHPVPKTPQPDMTPVTMFGGYPLAKTGGGLVIADDHMNPWFAVFSDLIKPVWHRDIMNTLGVPAVTDSVVFTNVGGPGALASMVAVDSKTGETKWEYAPKGIPEELTQDVDTSKTRALSNAEIALAKLNAKAAGLPGQLQAEVPRSEVVHVATPVLNEQHGHWTNPGLSLVDDLVYGEVGTSIVAVDQGSGHKKWTFDLKPGEESHSLVASKDHLFVSLNDRLIALNLSTGALEWEHQMMGAGTLFISKGLLFVAMGSNGPGGELMVFTTDEAGDHPAAAPPPKR